MSLDLSDDLLWRMKPALVLNTGLTGQIEYLDQSKDGNYLIVSIPSHAVMILYDLTTGAELHRYISKSQGLKQVKFTRLNKYVLAATNNMDYNAIQMWDLEEHTIMRSFIGHLTR
jgi:WD40 repeat protein